MRTTLFKPFDRWSERVLLSVGAGAALIGILLAWYFQLRFDGVLDLHFTNGLSLQRVALDVAIDFGSLLVLLYPAALWVNRKTRVVDILSAILVSKIPLYILAVFNCNNYMTGIGDAFLQQATNHESLSIGVAAIIVFILFLILSLVLLVWSVALLYNGYKTATNARGVKPVILFIIALLLAETLSKILIASLN